MATLVITPAPIEINGQQIPVTGGPWTFGPLPPPVVRVAGVWGMAVDDVMIYEDTAWQEQ